MHYYIVTILVGIILLKILFALRCPKCKKFGFFVRERKVGIPDAQKNNGYWHKRICKSCKYHTVEHMVYKDNS